MKIAIIDADLVYRKKHRFPNLACMKLSGYHKSTGDTVVLETSYDNIRNYDGVYISKVFTDTEVPEGVLRLRNVTYGGTGFYYDKAPALPYEVEHHFPDYHLYDDWVAAQIKDGKKPQEFVYYTDYSIGFLTRGCFRHCEFCVNKNYSRVEKHSPLDEFMDIDRPKICLLDDNFFGCADWHDLMAELKMSCKPFQFKQGLDERLLTDEKCMELFSAKYDGHYIFAFDNIEDAQLIKEKLRLMRRYTHKELKFYCLCAYDRQGKYDSAFWLRDIYDLFARIEILMEYNCLPYIMRFNRYEDSPYRGMYIVMAQWCNQPAFFKKKSLREFAEARGKNTAGYKAVTEFEKEHPEAARWLDMKCR